MIDDHLCWSPALELQNQHIYQNRELFIAYGVFLIAIILAISFFMAYAITRPIKALVEQTFAHMIKLQED